MKKNILILSLACAMLAGCTSTKKALADDNLRSEISWSAFCEARSYDLNDNTYLTINE